LGILTSLRRQLEKSDYVRRFFDEKSTFSIFVVLFTGLLTVITVTGKMLDGDKYIAKWLASGLTVNATTKLVEFKLWFIPVVLLELCLIVGSGLMVIQTLKVYFTQDDSKKALEDLMSAVRQIRDQGKQTKIKAWESLTATYLINKDFSGNITRTQVLKAVDQPVHFWESLNVVEDEADGASSLAAVNYRVRDLSSNISNIVYLPSENGRRCKKACLFFLPPIQPGERRKFEITYQWPGCFKRMRKNTEDIEFTTTTREVLPLYRLEVYLQDGTGATLECQITGDQHPSQTLTATPYEFQGWKGRGYIYEIKDIPAGSLRLILKAEVKN
jgi:hypothetical protein